ncbi:MAG: endonuclease [Paludibacteraceae bacterium]|nr:endonuclease [Paludibacteraceae bacterium]
MLAGDVQPSTSLTTYYANINGKSSNSDELRITLCTIISANYSSTGYSSLQNSMYAASSNPTDFVNGSDKTMEDIYSSKPYKSSDNGSSASDCGAGWNKEHTVPQSWFNEATPMKSDAFHVYPTDIRMNSLRSSYPYGENDASKGCSKYGYGSVGTSTFPGYNGTVFDPGEGGEHGSYKGDLARTYFYMATRYRTTNFTNGSGNTSFTYSGGVADLTDYMKNLMLKWHREDPVSEKELKRNNAIYAHQKNRNPFIDYPELVEYIWGTKKGQSVILTALVSGYDGGSTPIDPQTVVKYGVNWSVNGEVEATDSVETQKNITSLPAIPVSCSTESNVFMGWSTEPLNGTTDNAPAILYTTADAIPAITEDITLYAVFAKETREEGSAPATYIFDADNQTGWTNTATKANSYWILSNGKALTSPELDLAGLSSIVVNMRTYGGTQYDQLQIAAGSTTLTTLQATKGSTMTDYDWTNTQSLSGKSPLTFTCPNAGSTQGIGVSQITINATGTGISYSRYLTTCQGTTEIITLPTDAPARKILIGGQLYIQRGGQLFSIQGQQVR